MSQEANVRKLLRRAIQTAKGVKGKQVAEWFIEELMVHQMRGGSIPMEDREAMRAEADDAA